SLDLEKLFYRCVEYCIRCQEFIKQHMCNRIYIALRNCVIKYQFKNFVIGESVKSFFKEFRKFITKGNVLDLAVAVVIGSAFNAITNGLVKFIINPFIALLTGGVSLDGWKTVLQEAYINEAGVEVAEIAILWGEWIQTIVQFFIIALAIFIAVRFIRKAEKVMNAKELERKAAEEAKKQEEDKKKAEEAAALLAEKEAQLQAFYANVARQTELLEELSRK
ncbi:MAG: large conductance mechanosensitive channel protein MscL, partial [Clostridia bacterium]|nr:large conductance mechanosensitive channel protein MscL [Clostridia bacterium]